LFFLAILASRAQSGDHFGMSTKLRWGILGTGNIARQFATGLAASHHGTAVAVGSRSADSAAKFAANFQIGRHYGDYQSLIDDAEVDVVYNGLPNHLHADWTIAALRAGKHVLCEKPIAMDAHEAERMFDEARRANRMLMEAFMYRSQPLTAAVVEAVKSGVIGKLRLVRTSFCFRARKTEGNVRFVREMGGGSLMDIGCYCINFARFFAGCEPTAIHAAAHFYSSGVDDAATGMLVFPDGLLSSFTCATTIQADNTAYLCGDEGYIEIPIPWKPPKRSEFIIAHGQPPRMDQTSAATPPREVRTVECPGELYGIEADDFAECILDGRSPRISAEDSLGNMRVLDEMRRQIGLRFSRE
jgi:predicted dehydrogenase